MLAEASNAYNRFDVRHMPTGCGYVVQESPVSLSSMTDDRVSTRTWPTIWEVGSNWPHDGEIDILEGVNDVGPNAVTLHTGRGSLPCILCTGLD